jgi:hypothetical protein
MASASSEVVAGSRVANAQTKIKLNKQYTSWKAARDDHTKAFISCEGTSVWHRVRLGSLGSCVNSRADAARTDDFGLLLSVVEGSADV